MEKHWPRRHEPQGAERWFSAESEQGKISTGPAVSWGRRSGSSPSASCTAGAPSFRADLRLGFRCADGGDDDRTVRRRGRGGHLSSDRCAASLRTPASRTIGSGPRRNDLRPSAAGVRVEPRQDVAHAGGVGRGADELRDEGLVLVVVESHRMRPVAQERWTELRLSPRRCGLGGEACPVSVDEHLVDRVLRQVLVGGDGDAGSSTACGSPSGPTSASARSLPSVTLCREVPLPDEPS